MGFGAVFGAAHLRKPWLAASLRSLLYFPLSLGIAYGLKKKKASLSFSSQEMNSFVFKEMILTQLGKARWAHPLLQRSTEGFAWLDGVPLAWAPDQLLLLVALHNQHRHASSVGGGRALMGAY